MPYREQPLAKLRKRSLSHGTDFLLHHTDLHLQYNVLRDNPKVPTREFRNVMGTARTDGTGAIHAVHTKACKARLIL